MLTIDQPTASTIFHGLSGNVHAEPVRPESSIGPGTAAMEIFDLGLQLIDTFVGYPEVVPVKSGAGGPTTQIVFGIPGKYQSAIGCRFHREAIGQGYVYFVVGREAGGKFGAIGNGNVEVHNGMIS